MFRGLILEIRGLLSGDLVTWMVFQGFGEEVLASFAGCDCRFLGGFAQPHSYAYWSCVGVKMVGLLCYILYG